MEDDDIIPLYGWLGVLRMPDCKTIRVTGPYANKVEGKVHIMTLLQQKNIEWEDAFLVEITWGAGNRMDKSKWIKG
jgi:hypothetical protein